MIFLTFLVLSWSLCWIQSLITQTYLPTTKYCRQMKSTRWCFGQKQLKLIVPIENLQVYGVRIKSFKCDNVLGEPKMKFGCWSNKNVLFIYLAIKGACANIYLHQCISTCVCAKICIRQIFSFDSIPFFRRSQSLEKLGKCVIFFICVSHFFYSVNSSYNFCVWNILLSIKVIAK